MAWCGSGEKRLPKLMIPEELDVMQIYYETLMWWQLLLMVLTDNWEI